MFTKQPVKTGRCSRKRGPAGKEEVKEEVREDAAAEPEASEAQEAPEAEAVVEPETPQPREIAA